MQSLALADQHFPALRRGDKTQTIRFNEGKPLAGPLRFYSESTADLDAVVWVTRCTSMPLARVAAFLRKESDWPDEIMLTGMRQYYPEITLDDVVEVVEHLSPEETKRRLTG